MHFISGWSLDSFQRKRSCNKTMVQHMTSRQVQVRFFQMTCLWMSDLHIHLYDIYQIYMMWVYTDTYKRDINWITSVDPLQEHITDDREYMRCTHFSVIDRFPWVTLNSQVLSWFLGEVNCWTKIHSIASSRFHFARTGNLLNQKCQAGTKVFGEAAAA